MSVSAATCTHCNTRVYLSQTVGFINYRVVIPTLAWLFVALFLPALPNLEQDWEAILKAYENQYWYLNFLCLNWIITHSGVMQLCGSWRVDTFTRSLIDAYRFQHIHLFAWDNSTATRWFLTKFGARYFHSNLTKHVCKKYTIFL